MWHIRGLHDSRDNKAKGERRPLINSTKVNAKILSNSPHQEKDPFDETLFDMLRLNICPQFTVYSFAVIFSVFLFITFTLQITVDGIDKHKLETEFLPINYTGKISGSLSNNYDDLRSKKQIWRFATALLIHTNSYQLLANVLSLVIWSFYFNAFINSNKLSVIYSITGCLIRNHWQCFCSRRKWPWVEFNGGLDWDLRNFRNLCGIFDL
jgi:membrane associated rhomboid family serine protease